MTAIVEARASVRDGTPRTAPIMAMLAAQTRAQVRAFWRVPSVSASALLMPIMLFGFFVLPHAQEAWRGSVTVGASMLASIGAYAAGSVMVFNFGVTVALDRGQKVDLLVRTAPLPGWVYLVARLASALLFATLAVAALFAVAMLAGGIRLEPATWLDLGLRLLAGSIPLLALGFAIAYLAGPGAAPAIANMAYIGMAFASGMLVPLDQMPDVLRTFAPLLPTYHDAQLAWDALGVADEPAWISGGWLLGWTVVLLAVAAFAYRREEVRRSA